jgi:hypothetical protein
VRSPTPANTKAGTRFGDIVNQLHHDDGLADTSAAEQTNLAAAHKRLNQVNNLFPFQTSGVRLRFIECGRVTMD